jgi:hypothetical protein
VPELRRQLQGEFCSGCGQKAGHAFDGGGVPARRGAAALSGVAVAIGLGAVVVVALRM